MWSARYHLTEETSRFILSTGTETVAVGAVPHRVFVASGKTRTESDL
jgi:hypothetical protein